MQQRTVLSSASLDSDNTGAAPPPLEGTGADDDGEFRSGTVLAGSYRLIRRLGRGGMGDIHLASHERLPGQFVVKVLSPDLVSDQDAFVRFRQEAVAMASIRHPNVVQLVDFNFTLAGLPYLVMEYLPGKDLAEILSTRPFLPAAQVSTVVRQVACALDAAHRRGIVHRDLKPENIMVVPCDGQGDLIKLIDFGISKARRFNHVTAGSMVIGTPEFMSPEQAEGRHEDVDSPADQFALAVISYLLLTGRTPWGTAAPVEILHRVVNEGPLPVTCDDTWRAVEAVLFRGMAKSPTDRYPSTLAFWRALDQALVHDGILPAATSFQPSLRPPADPAMTSPEHACRQSEGSVEGPVDKEEEITARLAAGRRKRSRKGRHAVEAALFLTLAYGAYAGVLDAPTVRTRATDRWNTVRDLAVRAADQSVATGQRLFSRFVAPSGRKASIAEAAALP